MKYNSTIRKLSEIKTDILCVFADPKQLLGEEAKTLDKDHSALLTKHIKHGNFSGDSGALLTIPTLEGKAKHIVLIGLGASKELDVASFQKALDNTIKTVIAMKPKTLCFDVSALSTHSDSPNIHQAVERVIEKIADATYTFDHHKTSKSKTPALSQVTIACSKAQQSSVKKAINYAAAKAEGMSLTRHLGNEPGNVCTPSYLADTAKKMAKHYDALSCKVLDEKEIEKLKMGAFHSVAKGSSESGKLIILEYKGASAKTAPHVLVGKGITFDSGGISLKPGAQMDEMKYDMGGAASVLGTMKAVAELAPKKNIICVVAAAENMPAGHASKPGDIVTTLSGKTVEILNTDAEGRLVLCDALTYVERFKPKTVIDVATLTGACIIALGHATSAVMSNSDEFAQTLMQCGQEANDRAWQLPILDEYQKQLDSPFADMQNIGGRAAGSITAACFLSKFAEKFTWAHLDIAGTAWTSGADKGATGRPVPLLLNYLINHAS